MLYVILNDGETFSTLKSCAIYNSETKTLHRVWKGREIDLTTNAEGWHWEKGVYEILTQEENEERNINTVKVPHSNKEG